MVPYSTIKELHFVFKQKLSGMNFFFTPRGMMPWGVSFFFNENLKNLAKTKPNSKIFLPIGQWPKLVRIMKKTEGRKSRWTVPLNKRVSIEIHH